MKVIVAGLGALMGKIVPFLSITKTTGHQKAGFQAKKASHQWHGY